MGQTREWVVLIHKLRELAGTEELFNGCHDGADIDQGLWGNRFDVLCGHALAHHTLHTRKTGADLVLNQLTHRANTTVTKVVNVVHVETQFNFLAPTRTFNVGTAIVQSHQVLDRGDNVFHGQH